MSETSAAAYAQVLLALRDAPVSAKLHPQTGLGANFAALCHERAAAALDDAGAQQGDISPDDEDDREAWLREARTWSLMSALFHERITRAAASAAGEGEGESSTNPYETPLTDVQRILRTNPDLAELELVRNWLSTYLAPTHIVEVRKGYRPFTRSRLRAEKRSQLPSSSSGASSASRTAPRQSGFSASRAWSTVPSSSSRGERDAKLLDPDAHDLEKEDANYEKALLRALFEYARAGQLLDALDLCIQVDQAWRAASLRGAILHWRPGCDTEEVMEMEEATGNRNRTLWKAVCRALAAKNSLDGFERALYGALSGDLQSVLSVSETYEAQLWAYVNARLEASVDEALDVRLRATWWNQEADTLFPEAKETGSVRLSELSVPDALVSLRKDASRRTASDSPVKRELREIFAVLSQTKAHNIHAQAQDPFITVQRSLVLNEINELLVHVYGRLAETRHTMPFQQYARLSRFLAHFVLFLRLLQLPNPPPDAAVNGILRAYIDVLEKEREDDGLIALYASSLEPESATQSYAHYLRTMDVNTAPETKRAALQRAKEHDLDVAAVARTTVAMIFDDVFPSIPLLPSQVDPFTAFHASLDLAEEELIHAASWLTYQSSTYVDAIVQANVLMRLFLSTGKLHAARTLHLAMPPDVQAAVEDDGLPPADAEEHLAYAAFFEALDAYWRYAEVWSKRPEQGQDREQKAEADGWREALSETVAEAERTTREVLTTEWLKLELAVDDVAAERREAELQRVRQIYIPELVLRLHFMLVDTSSIFPSNLAAALQIPNLVADERSKLYLEFISSQSGNRLPEYLAHVRSAHLMALDQRGADSFKVATAF